MFSLGPPLFPITLPLSSNLSVDLDLLVFDSNGGLVAHSSSWDNSYEVVEFAANHGTTYDIVIRRWSGTDDTWFGLAWNVTGVRLLHEEIEGLTLERFNGAG